MLIIIHNSIKERLRSGIDIDDILTAIDQIGISIQKGNHAIFANRATFEEIINHNDIGSRTKTWFRSALSRAPQMLGMVDNISIKAELTLESEKIEVTRTHGKFKLSIPPKEFSEKNLFNSTNLILENISDSDIYTAISQWFSKSKLSANIKTNFSVIDGHGGGTSGVYQEHQNNEDCFTLCITDSDKKFPTDTLGQTALDTTSIDDQGMPLSSHHCLAIHELENLVPLSILIDIANETKSGASNKIVTALESIKNLDTPSPILYWDYKKGIRCKPISENEGAKVYWSEITKDLESFSKTPCTSTPCPSGCDKDLLPQWNQKQAVKDKINTKRMSLKTPTDDYLIDIWTEIGKSLIGWGICTEPVRS